MIKIPYYESSYFVFHNFSAHAINYNGITYPTAEHAFHSAKFDDNKRFRKDAPCETPCETQNTRKWA